MSSYRMVYQRVWGDANFRQLCDQAKLAWFYILTGPHTNGLPGIYQITTGTIADNLGWTVSQASDALTEIEQAGMLAFDAVGGVVFLPNFLKYNPPGSPKNLIHWVRTLDNIPESDLHQLWIARVRAAYTENGQQAVFDGILATEYGTHTAPSEGVSDAPSEGVGGDPDDVRSSISISSSISSSKENPVAADPDFLAPAEPEPGLWQSWVLELADKAKALKIRNGEVLAGRFAIECAREIQRFYDDTTSGGRFTPRRMDQMAKRLRRHAPHIQLAAMEIYVDNYGGKRDFRYVCGIADGKARLSTRELESEMKKHRRKIGDAGIYSEVLKEVRDGNLRPA